MKKQTNTNGNGSKLPRAKDFETPEKLTKAQKESLEAFREAMKALKEEEAKYGNKNLSLIPRFILIILRKSRGFIRPRFFRQLFYMS